MSKIRISELNTASLKVLNQEETTAVVGGLFDLVNVKVATINQGNFNATGQNAQTIFGGGNGNSNGTGQGNTAVVNQTL